MANGVTASTGIIPELIRSLAVGASPWKFSAKVVATSNVTLAGLQTIDSVSVDENDRVLCVAQTDVTKNLLYIAHASAWELVLDADQEGELKSGTTVYIARGTSAKSFWTLITPDDPIRIGITPLSWEKRIPESLVLLNTATVDPTPDTLLKRGPVGEGKVTSLELSSAGELRANIGGTEVTMATVDAGKNMQIGDAVDTESILTIAGTNKNITTAVAGTGTALLTAVGAASAVSIQTNGTEVLNASAGVLGFNGQQLTDAGGLEIVSPGEVHFDVLGTDVSALTVDAAKNVIVGDSTDGESVLIHAATNKSTQMRASGTGLAQLAAIGAASKVSLVAGGTEVVAIQNGGISLFASSYATAGLNFPNTMAPTIAVDSVASGTGKLLSIKAGDVTAGAGDGGTLALYAGINAAGETGNIVAVITTGASTMTGEFQWFDGAAVFLNTYANATTTTLNCDRATLAVTANTTLTLGAGGSTLYSQDATTITLSGILKHSGTSARQVKRYTTLADSDHTLDVDFDYYRFVAPAANRVIQLRTATAPIPITGEPITFARPATGAFTITLYNEGDLVNAIVTLTASNFASATVVFNGALWELADHSPNATPGPSA